MTAIFITLFSIIFIYVANTISEIVSCYRMQHESEAVNVEIIQEDMK